MRLYYYNQEPNFGDALNPWLWQQLIPELLDDDSKYVLVGIGTLINERLASKMKNWKAEQVVIFSTGVGYGEPPQLNQNFKVYCVRGPLSANKLGLSATHAITDGAYLIRNVLSVSQDNPKIYPYTYIPHHELAGEGWATICQELGWGYIDPRWPIEKIFDIFQKTEIVLAEAMHGAIVADALRIPWIPIVSNPSILTFKWQDWCQSINITYEPFFIERLHHPRPQLDGLSPLRLIQDKIRQRKAKKQLQQIVKTRKPSLSTDQQVERLTTQLTEKLEQLKKDYS